MDYMTPKEAGASWNITTRRVQTLCATGRVSGVVRMGDRIWLIPKNALKPMDGRTKAAKQEKQKPHG